MDFISGEGVVRGRRVQQLTFAVSLASPSGVPASLMDEERIRASIEDALLTDDEFEGFITGDSLALQPAQLDNPFANVPRCISL